MYVCEEFSLRFSNALPVYIGSCSLGILMPEISRFPHYKAIKEMTTRHKNQIKCNALIIVDVLVVVVAGVVPATRQCSCFYGWYFSRFPAHKAHIKLLWSKINDKENWQNQQLLQLLPRCPALFRLPCLTNSPALSIVNLFLAAFPVCFVSIVERAATYKCAKQIKTCLWKGRKGHKDSLCSLHGALLLCTAFYFSLSCFPIEYTC